MQGEYNNIRIVGMAASAPEYCLDNNDFANVFGERRTKKQIKLTGVVRHHVSEGFQKASDMSFLAARKLIDHLGWSAEELKVLLYVTQSPDYGIPSTAFEISNRLGTNPECMVYDINLGCSGFDYGIQTVAALMQTQEEGSKALLLTAELSPYLDLVTMDPQTMANTMMFGAGATCTALVKEQSNRICFANYSYGGKFDKICSQLGAPILMDGMAVVEFADKEVSQDVTDFINRYDLSDDMIDAYLFHQAQKMMVDTIMVNCKLPENKVLTSFEEYGNTSSASIPITLCHNLSRFQNQEYASFVSCGYGVGLSVGITYWTIETKNILPVFLSDEHFDDHISRRYFLYNRSAILYGANSPMLQMIGRELEIVGCELGAIGELSEIMGFVDSLFYKKMLRVGCTFESIKKDTGYDSIVFDGERTSTEEIIEACEKAMAEHIFSESSLVIIVSNDASDLESLQGLKEKGFRLLSIKYESEDVDLYPFEHGNRKWTNRRLHKKDSQGMANAIKIGYTIRNLLTLEQSGIEEAYVTMCGK